jgi:2-pyrone-4,6-dicarboxylate lactonase
MPILTQGPDPNTRTPKLVCPPGACDTHIHLFGPAAKYPFASNSPYTSREALPETNVALQDKLGLSTSVIISPVATAAITECWPTRSNAIRTAFAASR